MANKRIIIGLAGVACVAVAVAVAMFCDCDSKTTTPGTPTKTEEAPPALPSAATRGTHDEQPPAPGSKAAELREAERRLAQVDPKADVDAALNAAVRVLRLRCSLAKTDTQLQPQDCLRGLQRGFPVAVPMPGAHVAPPPGPHAETIMKVLMKAKEPHVQLGILQLYAGPLPDVGGLRAHLETMALGLNGPLAQLAGQRLLSMTPPPTPQARELARMLLREAHGDAIELACGALSSPQWQGNAEHARWIVSQIVSPNMRARARHCMVAALAGLGAVEQLRGLATTLAAGSAGDLAVKASVESAISALERARADSP